MSTEDFSGLIELAKEKLSSNFVRGRHQIICLARDVRGSTYLGIHVEASVGRASICAETIALGAWALSAQRADVEHVVCLRGVVHSGDKVTTVAPCGVCREVLTDYWGNAKVLLGSVENPCVQPLKELLPSKYLASKWNSVTI